jgi:hypothetical protein
MLSSLQAGSKFTPQSTLTHIATKPVRFGDNPSEAESRVLAIMNQLEPDLLQGNITWPNTRNTDGSYSISIGDRPFYLINTSNEANQAVGLPLQLGLISRVTGEDFRYTGSGCFSPPSAFYMKQPGQPKLDVSLELAPRIQNFFLRLNPPALPTQGQPAPETNTLMADVQDVLADLSKGDLDKIWKKLFG